MDSLNSNLDSLIQEYGWIDFLAALAKKMHGKIPLMHLRTHVKDAVYQLEAQNGQLSGK